MVQVTELADALRPAYILCKITATCPFTIRGQAGRRHLVILKRDIPIIMLQVLVNCCSLYLVNTIFYTDFLDQIDQATFFLDNVASSLFLLVNMLIFHVHRKDIVDILSTADEIDVLLSSLGCPMDYNVVFKDGIRSIVSALALALPLISGTSYYMGSDSIVQFSIPVSVGIGIRTLLYTFLSDARVKFSLINNALYSTIHNTPSTTQHISVIEDESLLVTGHERSKEMAELLHKIVNIHGKLGIYCYRINYVFHLHLVLQITSCLTATVASIYIFINNLREGNVSGVFVMFWSVHSIFVMVYMVGIFNSVTAEARKTNQLMDNFRFCRLCSDEISDLISVHMLRLKHQQVTFTACGLFPIDNTLLYAMTAATTTYIIILYQFKAGLK